MRKTQMKTVPVRDAVGCVLCHDMTEIVPGEHKGPAFRKGHVVQESDIERLLRMGKEHLYVYEPREGLIHEDEAARRLVCAIAGEHLHASEPKEGRIDLKAAQNGLLRVDVETLTAVNRMDGITVATLHSWQYVTKGRTVAGTRIVPLLIEDEVLQAVEQQVKKPLIDILPLKSAKVGLVTTGSEIASGRIKDAFGPVLCAKFAELGSTVLGQSITSDNVDEIVNAIRSYLDQGVDCIAVTGGMSVDPDDTTPLAIRAAGAEIVCYGAPVYPGAMFLLAWAKGPHGQVPILGLPGCVMYYKASIFDLVVPRLLAGCPVTAETIAALGHGGLCSQCTSCHYPVCPFGK